MTRLRQNTKPSSPSQGTETVGAEPYGSLWESFAEESATPANTPTGPGWRTTKEIAKLMNRSVAGARTAIKGCMSKGTMEQFIGTQVNAGGAYSQQIWYRPKKPAKQSIV